MKTPSAVAWIAATGLFIATLGAQTPAPVRPSGLVMGVVVDSITEKPVPSTIVSIGTNKVRTDDEGRFVFADLPRGVYAIDAVKPGYFDGSYGRQRPDGPAAMLALGADERVGNLRIPLFRFAAISGMVLDESGETIVGAEVEVLARTWVGGRRVLERAGIGITDDRGVYRVDALGSGEFVIAAIFHSLPVVVSGGKFIYPVHYFPGGTSIEQATAVQLKVGEDHSGVDISLRLSAASKVSGILRTSSGAVAGPVVLATSESADAGAGLDSAEVFSEPSGSFTLLAVPTGSYLARSVVRPPPVRTENSLAPTRLMWASVPVVVNDTDVSNVDVLLRPGYRMAGRFVFEGASGSTGSPRGRGPGFEALRRLTATIDSMEVDMRLLRDAAVTSDASGSFASTELPPGRYFMRVENAPPGWTLKRISLRGRDLSNAPIPLDADVTGLIFTFTDRPTDLGGFVRNDAGAIEGSTVLVFPRDRETWVDFGRKPLGFRASRSSRDGSFHFVGLPPGDYFVIAVDDAAATDWQQAKRLELLARSATSVTLSDGDKHAIDVRPVVIR